jgi:hypothetical protein
MASSSELLEKPPSDSKYSEFIYAFKVYLANYINPSRR